MARHSLEEHIGEVELRLEGQTLAELFEEAARAIAELIGGAAAEPPPASPRRDEVRLEAPDRDALLVEWLNELIYRSERDRSVFGDARVEWIDDRSLRATFAGRRVEEPRLHVKAATFHGLRIQETPGGWAAHVVLDV